MGNLDVVRFRYAPASLERLAYDGGILANISHRPWTLLLVPFFIVAEVVACIRAIRRVKPDAIHAHWIIPQGFVVALARLLTRSRIPVLTTSHGGDLYAFTGFLGRLVKKFALSRSNRATVVSHAMRDVMKQELNYSGQVDVIPMGTDARERFSPGRQEDRVPGTILFVGRLVEKKGTTVLLDAFKQLLAGRPDSKLRIVGEGPLRQDLERKAADLGIAEAVTFTGAVTPGTVADEMKKCAIFVMPAIRAASGDQEGFGLVICEAMASGIPVIASDLPPIQDIVHHEETGLRSPPGNAEELARHIDRLLGDQELQLRLALKGREHVLDNFDWSSIALRYQHLIMDLVEHRTSDT